MNSNVPCNVWPGPFVVHTHTHISLYIFHVSMTCSQRKTPPVFRYKTGLSSCWWSLDDLYYVKTCRRAAGFHSKRNIQRASSPLRHPRAWHWIPVAHRDLCSPHEEKGEIHFSSGMSSVVLGWFLVTGYFSHVLLLPLCRSFSTRRTRASTMSFTSLWRRRERERNWQRERWSERGRGRESRRGHRSAVCPSHLCLANIPTAVLHSSIDIQKVFRPIGTWNSDNEASKTKWNELEASEPPQQMSAQGLYMNL